MLKIVLYQPEIPPNTGNILRLAANTGAALHLVRPLGFRLNDKTLARAGMDYRQGVDFHVHENWSDCLAAMGRSRVFLLSTGGSTTYSAVRFADGDALVFGSEGSGLPDSIHASVAVARRLRIPMRAGSRSLNLANAAAVVVYEAWRQLGFAGAGEP